MKCTITIALVLFANIAHNVYSKVLIPPHIASRTVEDNWAPDPLCPYPSEDLTFFPYPEDCSKYYECYEGDKYLITCPSTMFWDTNNNVCQSKLTVNCGGRGSSTASPTTPTTPTTTPGSSTASPTTPTTPTTTPDNWAPDPLCPYPSEDLTFFPYPEDCGKYYECYEGNKYLITCPSTMFWDTNNNVCQSKLSVNCGGRGSSTASPTTPTTPTTTPGPTDGPTPTPTPAPTGTPDPTAWTPDPLCPYPSEDLTFYPNYSNCTQYFECYEGNRYLITCPRGLAWDDNTHACEPIQSVNCDRRSTTHNPNTGPTPAPDTRCVGQPDGSFHANPDDCSKFYECNQGKAIDEKCPNNTLWNEVILTCDYPANVKC